MSQVTSKWRSIDCSSPDIVDCIQAAILEPANSLRHLSYLHRPQARGPIHTVGLHYWRYGIGGAEKVTHALMELFIALGLNVVLYTDEPPQPNDYPIPSGVVRKTVPHDSAQRIEFWLNEGRSQSLDAVIYSSWLSEQSLVDCMAIQASGAAYIYHTHGVSTYFMGSDLDSVYLDRMLKIAAIAEVTIALSETDAIFWRAVARNVQVVVNPVDRYMHGTPPRPVPLKTHTIAFCGRLDPLEKRPVDALYIFAKVAKKIPDANLLYVGGGFPEEEGRLRLQARELGLENRVEFLGFQADILPHLARTNAIVVTSPSEGFCLSLAESACLGIPAVAFAIPNVPFAQGNPGIVQVEQGDIEGAAEALITILQNPQLQESMGTATRSSYERACAVDLDALWKQILELANDTRTSMPESSAESTPPPR